MRHTAKAVRGGARGVAAVVAGVAARTDERGVGGGGGVEERRGEGIVERGEDLVRVRVRLRGRGKGREG